MKKYFLVSLLCLSCANITVSNSCIERFRELKINSITQQTTPDSEEQRVQAWNAVLDACVQEQQEKDEAMQQSLNKVKREILFVEGFALAAWCGIIFTIVTG